MNAHLILKHAHSGIRWALLAFLILAIVVAFQRAKKNGTFDPKDRSIPLFAMILLHLQVLLGLVLYFISPHVQFAASTMKDSTLRFYTVEHILMMVIAAVLITIGWSKAKKSPANSWKLIFKYYLISLIIILVAIPWPFRNLSAGWF